MDDEEAEENVSAPQVNCVGHLRDCAIQKKVTGQDGGRTSERSFCDYKTVRAAVAKIATVGGVWATATVGVWAIATVDVWENEIAVVGENAIAVAGGNAFFAVGEDSDSSRDYTRRSNTPGAMRISETLSYFAGKWCREKVDKEIEFAYTLH